MSERTYSDIERLKIEVAYSEWLQQGLNIAMQMSSLVGKSNQGCDIGDSVRTLQDKYKSVDLQEVNSSLNKLIYNL